MSELEKQIDWSSVRTHLRERVMVLGRNSGRLFHGRSGNFPGLDRVVIDAYPPVIVIASYGSVDDALLRTIAAALQPLVVGSGMVAPSEYCLLHQLRDGRQTRWTTLTGLIPKPMFASHLNLDFEVVLGTNQNVGIFLDMELGHRLVQDLASGMRILNLFAYTCVFSVFAMQAGATSVVNVDLSKKALQIGRRNHLRNGLDTRHVRFLPHNVMKSMGAFRRLGPFDIIICDPPSFQAGSFQAIRDYPKLAKRLSSCLKPGGDIIACLNAPFLDQANLDDWFDAKTYRCLGRYGRPDAYGESNPDRDLKIHHFRRITDQKQSGGSPINEADGTV